MGKHVRGREALSPSRQSVPVPTVGQVLVRALPAAIALVAGFPLLAWWWSLNDDSPIWALLAVLGGGYLLGWGILQITQAPHPRLGKKAERESLQRTIASTAENGMPPPTRRNDRRRVLSRARSSNGACWVRPPSRGSSSPRSSRAIQPGACPLASLRLTRCWMCARSGAAGATSRPCTPHFGPSD